MVSSGTFWLTSGLKSCEPTPQRRRIKTTEKAKVVTSVGEEEFIKFLAALAILPRKNLKNRMNSSFSFKSSWCNSSYYSKSSAARN